MIRRKGLIILSLVHSLMILLICYGISNTPYSLSGEKSILTNVEAVKRWWNESASTLPDNAVAINVSYDKQLVDVADDFGIPVGNTDITDRHKLLELLDILDSVSTYRYILMDISFSSGLRTPDDSTLYQKIHSMKRIVIPQSFDMPLASPLLMNKAYPAVYNTSIQENDFVKYSFVESDGTPSLPLQMWKDYTGDYYYTNGLWAFSHGRFCRTSMFLSLPVRIVSPINEIGQKTWLNLGTDILNQRCDLDYKKMFDNKFIIIGSFVEDDIHNTYAGNMPGVLVNFNAFLTLLQGDEYVSWWSLLLIYVAFLLTSFSMFSRKSLWNLLHIDSFRLYPAIRVVLSWVGLSIAYYGLFAIVYFVWNTVYDFLLISSYFAFLSILVEFYQKHKEKILLIFKKK